jgi:hypothetical protein
MNTKEMNYEQEVVANKEKRLMNTSSKSKSYPLPGNAPLPLPSFRRLLCGWAWI